MNWPTTRVVVTGGAGFLGSALVRRLHDRGCQDIFVPRSKEYDLRDRDAIVQLYKKTRPQLVFHLAAAVGGIAANQANPARFFYDNAIMGIQLLEYARQLGVEKFVAVGTICAYPKITPSPFREEHLWDGYPDETNAPYGLAKKMLLVQSQAYRAQYGFNAIYPMLANLYGPNDNFDPETSHVIPALIRKCVEAKESGKREIVLWGDGSPTREFLYVEDAAEALLLAAERYDGRDPINIGSGEEIAIHDLARLVASEVGLDDCQITWDRTKPNGQPRRHLNVERAERLLGFRPVHSLRDGIARTVAWFLARRRPPTQEGTMSKLATAVAVREPTDLFEKITFGGLPLAYIIRAALMPTRTTFLTPPEFKQQVGFVVHPAGGEIQRHLHRPLERHLIGTSEVLILRHGRCVIDIYNDDRELVATRDLREGDIMLMVGGGHGFRMLEDTVFLEVKQGPYSGEDEKVRF